MRFRRIPAFACRGLVALLAAIQLPACSRPTSAGEPSPEPQRPAAASPRELPGAVPPPITPDEARRILAQAAARAPNDPVAQLEAALFDLRSGDADSALRQLQKIHDRFPRNARAAYHLGMLHLMRAQVPEAVIHLEAAARLAPDDLLSQVNAGHALVRAGRVEEAIARAQRAIRIDPRAPDPHLVLAEAYDRHGTALKAIEHARKYAELSPKPAAGLYLVGRTYARQADGANAEQWLKRAIEADPENPEIWTTLGRVYYEIYRTTRTGEAVKCFERALDLDPKQWEAHLWLGRACASESRFPEAVAHFQSALKNSPQPGPIYYDLAQALLKSGRQKDGEEMLATYNRFREYTAGLDRMTAEIQKTPRDLQKRVALIEFCIRHRQYRAARRILSDSERDLGKSPSLTRLRKTLDSRIESLNAIGAAPLGEEESHAP